MISLQNVTAGYGKQQILHTVSASFMKGKITCIIGRNGCGKSTLLKCIARYIKPTTGSILVDDKNVSEIEMKEYAKLVSVLPQFREIPMSSVESFVAHGVFPYLGFSRKLTDQHKASIINAMQLTDVFSYRNKMMVELSGGERQKVYLAMMLAQNTPILLMDEPTTFLDINHQLEFLQLLKQLRNQGKTILVVMHDLEQAIQISDYICFMEHGKIIAMDTTAAVLQTQLFEKVFHIKLETAYYNDKTHYFFTSNTTISESSIPSHI